MSGSLYFAVGTIGLSKREGRKPSTLLNAARHNRRAIQAELGAYGHIDAARTCDNETIAGADSPEAVVSLASSLMADAGVDVGKLRKDYCQAIELLFSLPTDTAVNTGKYFKSCLAWAGEHFGKENILSADVHHDESAPHCHILILPLSGGRHVGSALIGRVELKKLRTSFAKKVGEPFGLKEPPRRLSGAVRSQIIRSVLQRLETTQDAILRSPLWPMVKRDIESDPARFAQAMGIELCTTSEQPRKTMAQIFTSTGKGGKTERKYKPIGFDTVPKVAAQTDHSPSNQKPIGFENRGQKHRNLCSVGFDAKQSPLNAISEPAIDQVRVRESEIDAAFFDAETGEFLEPSKTKGQRQKDVADSWVADKLNQLTAQPRHDRTRTVHEPLNELTHDVREPFAARPRCLSP
jgi:Plasmid recombination enzyme